MGKKTAKGKQQVDAAVFIECWERWVRKAINGKCEDPTAEIAKELNLEKSTVTQRASNLRNPKVNKKSGKKNEPIPLTEMPRRSVGRKSNINNLAAQFKEIQAKAWAAADAEE